MKEDRKNLSEAELDVMQAVWDISAPASSSQIQAALQGRRNWALATLMTVLDRLCNKGILNCEKHGRNNIYTALISRKTYQQREGKTLLNKIYGNSVTGLVAALYDGKAITDEDMDELLQFLNNWREEQT